MKLITGRKKEKIRARIYLVEGFSIAEYKIDGALDVAILEVMAATVVVESVLSAEESAAPKRRLVAADSDRHRLCSDVARPWNWRYILPNPRNISLLWSKLNCALVE